MNKLEHPSGISVELLNHMNDDLSIVNAARVSYGKESQYEYWRYNSVNYGPGFGKFERQGEEWVPRAKAGHPSFMSKNCYITEWIPCLSKADAGLLEYLIKNRHGTPLEMVQFQFRIHVPIGVGREWMRHRIGSFNEISTRYVKFEKDYYIPECSEWRTQVGKPGHYQYITITDGTEHAISVEYEMAMEKAYNSYVRLIEMGLAREVARNVLPLGTFTTFVWSVNLRSLMNFLSLRTAPDALKEIQIAACMVEQLVDAVVPETMNLWRRYGKICP